MHIWLRIKATLESPFQLIDFLVTVARTTRAMNPTVVALTALLAACSSCGSNDDAVAFAHSLSQPRLTQLFRDLEKLSSTTGQDRLHIDTRTGIPDAFKDLDPQSIVIDGHTARVHLTGCVDDKVLLVVKGIRDRGRKEITLLPGESKGAVRLWKSD